MDIRNDTSRMFRTRDGWGAQLAGHFEVLHRWPLLSDDLKVLTEEMSFNIYQDVVHVQVDLCRFNMLINKASTQAVLQLH